VVGVLDPLVVITHQLEAQGWRIEGKSEGGDGEARESPLTGTHEFILPRGCVRALHPRRRYTGGGRSAPRGSTLRRVSALWLLAVLACWLWLIGSSVRLGFCGDDFQWWQHARMALAKPALLFQAYGGFRVVNTWTLALDHVLFGTRPLGYHVTNLLLYVGCAFLLWLVAARFAVPPAGRAAIAALWLLSPYSLEPSISVAQRFEPIQLACWLGLVLIWPREGEEWRRGRVVAATAIVITTVLNKENWVVLPGLTLVLDVAISRIRWVRALRRSALISVAVAAYAWLYLRHPPIAPASFFSSGLAGTLKVPNAWAAFSLLGEMQPAMFGFGVPEAAALVTIAALAWLGWRRRSPLVAVGLALFLLPFIPLLPIGWSTSRYTTVPLAGFLFAVAGGVREVFALLGNRFRGTRVGVVACGVLAALAANVTWLRGDLNDYRAYYDAHLPLLEEARGFAPKIAGQNLIITVQLEDEQPLVPLSNSLAGIPKVYFVRTGDPYTLIDWAALFSYVLDEKGGPLFVNVVDPTPDVEDCAVVGHVRGGFVELPRRAPACAGEATAWRTSRVSVRPIQRWSG